MCLNFTSELQAFGFTLQIKKPSEQPRTANKWKCRKQCKRHRKYK